MSVKVKGSVLDRCCERAGRDPGQLEYRLQTEVVR
jgi:hypothetical protein